MRLLILFTILLSGLFVNAQPANHVDSLLGISGEWRPALAAGDKSGNIRLCAPRDSSISFLDGKQLTEVTGNTSIHQIHIESMITEGGAHILADGGYQPWPAWVAAMKNPEKRALYIFSTKRVIKLTPKMFLHTLDTCSRPYFKYNSYPGDEDMQKARQSVRRNKRRCTIYRVDGFVFSEIDAQSKTLYLIRIERRWNRRND